MPTPGSVQRTYLVLLLGNTLAASLIWGINTIFLLDAGLSNLEAFAANAFFTACMVLFEVPTGVVADTVGRRTSYLLGTVTLAASTLLYVLLWKVHAPFWQWAIVSILIGLGFTFFSGAVEAWLVDALKATGFTGDLESVFGRGQVVTGVAMLTGSVAGGLIAQETNLGIPFVLRGLILVAMFVVAFRLMHDVGFSPEKGGRVLTEIRKIASASIEYGLRVPSVRWLMIESLFTGGVGIYGFYALQPYLLKLYGDPHAYLIAGLTAILQNFWIVIGLVIIWSLIFAASMPIRQTYMNGMIPSRQRATILSFDSLMGSTGGVWGQPLLGRVADVWGYGPSYVVGAAISAIAIPCLALSRRQNAPADTVQAVGTPNGADAAESGVI